MLLQTQLVRPTTPLVQICQYRYHLQGIAIDIMCIQEIPIIYTLELGMIIISTMGVIMDMVDMIMMAVILEMVVITTSVILEMVVTRMAVILEMVVTRMTVILEMVVIKAVVLLGMVVTRIIGS